MPKLARRTALLLITPVCGSIVILFLTSSFAYAEGRPHRNRRAGQTQMYSTPRHPTSGLSGVPVAGVLANSSGAQADVIHVTMQPEKMRDPSSLALTHGFEAPLSTPAESRRTALAVGIYGYNPVRRAGGRQSMAEAYRLLILGVSLLGAGTLLKFVTRRWKDDPR